MSRSPITIALVCALSAASLSAGGLAFAQDAGPATGEVIVIVEPERDTGTSDLRGDDTRHNNAAGALGESAFATVVRADDSEGETRSIAEVLARTASVAARSLGGLGAFSSISVRGADAGHTGVSVDGVPLSRIASVTANLGQYDLGSFETIELYRGGVPVELGGAGVGGALEMHTALGRSKSGKAFQLSTGMGSHGARHLNARWLGGARQGTRAYHVSAGYGGANGDFAFFDDGGTPLNRDDDRIARRENNGYDRFSLVGRARFGKWTLGTRSTLQNQGLPGNAHDQAQTATLDTAQEIVDLQYRNPFLWDATAILALRGYASVERQHFLDPDDEIGLLGQDAVYLTRSLGLGSNLRARVSTRHEAAADLEARIDHFRDTPQGPGAMPPASGDRESLALALSDQAELIADRLYVDVGVRAELLRTAPSRDVFETAMVGAVRHDLFLSPRIAVRDRLATDLVVKASAGRYLRTPTLLEMFGDRGFILGNPELDPEVGYTGDVGVVWAPWRSKGLLDRIYLEAAAFASQPEKPIVFVNRNGLVAQAINLDGARMWGAELVASLRVQKRITLTGNYGFLDARNLSEGATLDKQLPGRPRQHLYLRADAAFAPKGHLLVLWGDVLRLSGNFVDELNIYELPPRFLVGLGVKLELIDDLLLGAEIKNAADLRQQEVALRPAPGPDFASVPKAVSDVHGYPLPGRSFYFNLQYAF